MKYIVDIDNTICITKDSNYYESKPIKERIEKINKLYDNGDQITYWTARGANSGKNWHDHTYKQLLNWGCKFHYLKCDKPHYDLWIDDKAVSDAEFFKIDPNCDYSYEGIPPHG